MSMTVEDGTTVAVALDRIAKAQERQAEALEAIAVGLTGSYDPSFVDSRQNADRFGALPIADTLQRIAAAKS